MLGLGILATAAFAASAAFVIVLLLLVLVLLIINPHPSSWPRLGSTCVGQLMTVQRRIPSVVATPISSPLHGTWLVFSRNPSTKQVEVKMARAGLLWLLGIPIPILLLMWALGWLH